MDAGVGIGGRSKSVVSMTTSRLDRKSPQVVEQGVKKRHVETLHTNSTINTENAKIDFNMTASPDKWCDLSTAMLHGKMGIQIKKKDETVWESMKTFNDKTGAKPTWGLVNNVYHSLFSNCIVAVNNHEVGDTSAKAYPYLSYLQTLLSTSVANSKSHALKEIGFIKDQMTVSGESEIDTGNDSPYQKRRKPFLTNKMVDFHIPLQSDLMNMEKYLPPNVELSFKLQRNDDAFLFWNGTATPADSEYEYKIVLEDLSITIDMCEVEPSVLEDYRKDFANLPTNKKPPLQKFKFVQNDLKSFTVATNQTELKKYDLFSSTHLPDKVYVVVVDQMAFNGTSTKNSFNFERSFMRKAFLKVNQDIVPNPPYEYTAGHNENMCYRTFLENTGTGPFELETVDISNDEWKNGFCVYAFDRSPTRDNGLYNHYPTSGAMHLTIEMSEPTKKNYMVLVMACYDKSLVLDEDKASVESLIPPQ